MMLGEKKLRQFNKKPIYLGSVIIHKFVLKLISGTELQVNATTTSANRRTS